MPLRRYLSWLSPTRVTLGVLSAGYLAILSLSWVDRGKQGGNAPADLVWTLNELQEVEAAKLAASDMIDRLTKVERQVQAELGELRASEPREEPAPGSLEAFHVIVDGFHRKRKSTDEKTRKLDQVAKSFRINEPESYKLIKERVEAIYDSRLVQYGDLEKALERARDKSRLALPTLLKDEWPDLSLEERSERMRIAKVVLDLEHQDRLHHYYIAEAKAANDKTLEAVKAHLTREFPKTSP